MNELTIRLSVDQIAEMLKDWPVDDLMELIQTIDEARGSWALVAELKKYADQQLAEMHDGTQDYRV